MAKIYFQNYLFDKKILTIFKRVFWFYYFNISIDFSLKFIIKNLLISFSSF